MYSISFFPFVAPSEVAVLLNLIRVLHILFSITSTVSTLCNNTPPLPRYSTSRGNLYVLFCTQNELQSEFINSKLTYKANRQLSGMLNGRSVYGSPVVEHPFPCLRCSLHSNREGTSLAQGFTQYLVSFIIFLQNTHHMYG